MPEVVFVDERVLRSALYRIRDYGVELRIVLVSEEHRFNVGVLDLDMDHAVVFLVFAGELMLFDFSLGIIVGVSAQHKTVLCPSVHGLGIYVVARLSVLDQPSFVLPSLEVLDSLVVDPLVMVGENGIEIDFGFGDMEEGFLSGHLLGFLRIQHVIGGCSNFCHDPLGRTYCCEWFDSYHLSGIVCIICSLGNVCCRWRRSPLSGGLRRVRRSC